MSASPIKLLIVEDQQKLLTKQCQLLLPYADQVTIVATARDGARALEAVSTHRPDVILLDLGLPDIDGIEVTKRVKQSHPTIEVLIFTIFDEEARVLDAVRVGASGYLVKGTPAARLVDAIVEVHQGGSVIQPRLARSLLQFFQHATPEVGAPQLTARETEILVLIAKGLTNRDAAETLKLSRATVRTHLEHIYQKLEVSNRTEAVAEAIRRGIISP